MVEYPRRASLIRDRGAPIRALLAGLAPLALVVAAIPAQAQTNEAPGAAELRTAMVRVARNPQDSEALLDAGNAALQMGDSSAAEDFLRRAERYAPANGRIKAARGVAAARAGDPAAALPLFAEAERLGVGTRSFAGDRALAYDLVGQFARADADYRLARGAADSESLVISHAISLALAGRDKDADALLDPLVRRNDPAAWRARAFILAARGDEKEADRIARSFLSPQAADSLKPYFARMERLTDAQRAAALHFGRFPPVDSIGRDSEAIRAAAAAVGPIPVRTASLTAAERLVPSGESLDTKRKTDRKTDRRTRDRDRTAEATRSARRQTDQAPATASAAGTRRAAAGTATTAASATSGAAPTRLAALPAPDGVRPAVSSLPPVSSSATRAGGSAPPPAETPAAVTVRELPATGPAVAGTQASAIPAAPSPDSAAAVPSAPANASRAASPPATVAPPPAAAQAPTPAAAPATAPVTTTTAPGQASPPSAVSPAQRAGGVAAGDPPRPAFAALAASGAAPVSAAAAQGPTADGTPVAAEAVMTATAVGAPAAVTPAEPAGAVSTATLPPAPARSFADIVGALEIPATETRLTVVPVDLASLPTRPVARPPEPARSAGAPAKIVAETKAVAAKGKAKKEEPPAPKHPARIWVQVATGSNLKALAYDWRNLKKKAPDLYGKQEAWTSAWGSRQRMVVGPFKTLKEAKSFEAAQRKAGGDGFVWQSENGLAVDKLG